MIDRKEVGRNKIIHKVDQLHAMKWVNMAWKEILEETNQNIWKHTKIISPCNQNRRILTLEVHNSAEPIKTVEESAPKDQLRSHKERAKLSPMQSLLWLKRVI